MDQQYPKKFNSVATQTDPTSNKVSTLDPLGLARHEALFSAYDETPTPLYCENLNRFFNEVFIAQFSKKKELSPIIEIVKNAEWKKLKPLTPCITAFEETDQFLHPDA